VYYAGTQKWDCWWNKGRFVLEDALKFKFAIYVICLLLFVAAVDTIPDPPAINPPSGHSYGISALHVRGAITQLEKKWFATPGSLRSEQNNNWLCIRLAFDCSSASVFTTPLVHHAADNSPPAFS
jgi:hypothetical protein